MAPMHSPAVTAASLTPEERPAEPPVPILRLVPGGRHFLFLQGLPGPFFRRLGAALRARGARVSRVNFNGGDLLDWSGAGTVAYRGTREDWPLWLAEHVRSRAVTDIVVFGDLRDIHQAARRAADRLGLRFHAFEEGYLRPNHVTLERGGVNGDSSFPKSLRALRLLAERIPAPPPEAGVPNHFGHRARQVVLHSAATLLARPFFPHYRSHRLAPAWREGLGWGRRLLRRAIETAASGREMRELGDRPFFLLPLQLEGDAQLRFHSRFASMREALGIVLASFREAPEHCTLLVKRHPLDPDVAGWRRIVERAAADAGVAGRVRFIERFDLPPLLRAARGVVTVNSTVGPLALRAETPVLALGDAIYNLPGVTADCTLEYFWHAPPPVQAANFELLCSVLRAKCLVNGGFHSAPALDRLVAHSAERLLRP